jgi:hypothetical protein
LFDWNAGPVLSEHRGPEKAVIGSKLAGNVFATATAQPSPAAIASDVWLQSRSPNGILFEVSIIAV